MEASFGRGLDSSRGFVGVEDEEEVFFLFFFFFAAVAGGCEVEGADEGVEDEDGGDDGGFCWCEVGDLVAAGLMFSVSEEFSVWGTGVGCLIFCF